MHSGLLVMPPERADSFQSAVAGSAVEWTVAESCEAARGLLAAGLAPAVVVSNSTVSDGNWYCVLEQLLSVDSDAALLVVVPEGGDVGTILEHGVTGVVRYPFDDRAAAVLEEVLSRRVGPQGPASA